MQSYALTNWRRLSPASLLFAFMIAVFAMLGGQTNKAGAQQTMASSDKIWGELKGDFFGDRPIVSDTGLVRIEAPKRAQDAALVPVDIYIDPAKAPEGVKAVTLIIDVNPAPLAATFTLGKDAGVTHISTRVRVNDYSWLRAIAETGGRRAPYGANLRQGVGRLLGAGGEEHRRSDGLDGQDEARSLPSRR